MTTLLERLEELMAELESGALNYAEDAEAKDEIIDHAPDLLKAVRALIALRDAVRGEPAMNNKKYDTIGIQVTEALAPFMEQKP